MEFEDLGKHCAFCNQKDILPMQCGSCHQYFCLEHIQREQHKCEKMNSNEKMVIVCKKCDQLIQLIPGVDPKILIEEHTRFYCNPKLKKVQKICSAPNCNTKLYSSNSYQCSHCGKEVCMKHRFPEDHNCSPPKKTTRNLASFFSFFNKQTM